jgi:DNA-binding HxlR family transcriptional regulator
MNYQKAILEALMFPCVGMQFNELLEYLHRRGYHFLSKKTLNKELRRLEAKRLITNTFLPLPNGKTVRLYTSTEGLSLQYALTYKELSRLLMRKYKSIQAKLSLK